MFTALCVVYLQCDFLVRNLDGNTVSVDSGWYVNILNDFFFPLLNDQGINTNLVYFQQDDATSHSAHHTIHHGHVEE